MDSMQNSTENTNSMTEVYDLHCHSTASDGSLRPAEVIQRAHDQGVTALALTDHDTTEGLAAAQQQALAMGIKLIPGIELSANWNTQCFHIVGLGIDPKYPPLATATQNLQNTRIERAEKIATKLEKCRIHGALEAVLSAAGDGMITRSHFADFLVAQHHVSTQQEAFDRYLAKGKPAYVATPWAEMEQAVSWITESGGIAVLTAFKEAGGRAIEVVTGRCNADEITRVAAYASRFELAGSTGSDFHSPDNQWVELGRLAPLPPQIQPVWELFK
jgi:predicted metal-dependent phosphoesterase TrpH